MLLSIHRLVNPGTNTLNKLSGTQRFRCVCTCECVCTVCAHVHTCWNMKARGQHSGVGLPFPCWDLRTKLRLSGFCSKPFYPGGRAGYHAFQACLGYIESFRPGCMGRNSVSKTKAYCSDFLWRFTVSETDQPSTARVCFGAPEHRCGLLSLEFCQEVLREILLVEETPRWGIWDLAFPRVRWRIPSFWNELSLASSAVSHALRVGTSTVSRRKGSPVDNAWVSLMGSQCVSGQGAGKGPLERTTK